jgi:hypothetical protein
MSAVDTFEKFTSSLSSRTQESIKDFIRLQRTELLAARSEDARNRVVQNYITGVHDLLEDTK